MVGLTSLNPFAGSLKSTVISELRIYPIKSCRGIVVPSAQLTKLGLRFDRGWMFVDPKERTTSEGEHLYNEFITIRNIKELTLVDVAFETAAGPSANGLVDDVELVISIRNSSPLKSIRVPAEPNQNWLGENTKLEQVYIWGKWTDAWVCSDEISAIFSEFLGRPVKLVHKGPSTRLPAANGAPEHLGREAPIRFPDMMPIQIANEASIHELNGRLRAKNEREITIERYRPNIIIKGGDDVDMPAWSEDMWKTVRIVPADAPQTRGWLPESLSGKPQGAIDIDVVMRCARCQVPNVDPDTAEKDKKEPWTTTMSYRRVDEGINFKPCFGMLCAPIDEGDVKVGMRFEVLAETTEHCWRKG